MNVGLDVADKQDGNPSRGKYCDRPAKSSMKCFERFGEERKALTGDIRGIYAKAKSAGLCSSRQTVVCMKLQTIIGIRRCLGAA